MPPSATKPQTKTPGQKGKPLGIPTWGWIVGGVAGLIIGYIILRHSGTAAASNSGLGAVSPQPQNPDSAGGGVVASPPAQVVTSNGQTLAAAGVNSGPLSSPSPNSVDTTTLSGGGFTPGTTIQSGPNTFQQVGSDVFVPLPPSHPGSTSTGTMISQPPGSSVVKPGFQPM